MTRQSRQYRVRVKGPLACFTRPETKSERVSYEVITPSAARGVLEAILWKPAITWRVHEIHVLAPIRWASFRRNEVEGRASERRPGIAASEARAQRNTVALRDVDYGLVASFEMMPRAGVEETVQKFEAMFERRIKQGQQYHQPYLGCREFAATVGLEDALPAAIDRSVTRPLGWMFYDFDYGSGRAPRPLFFDARLDGGVVRVPALDEVRCAAMETR